MSLAIFSACLPALRMPLQAQRMPLRAEAQRARTVQMGGAAPYPYNFITIEPTYTINDPEAVQQIMLEYVERSKSEPGLCYCDFTTTRSAPDDTAPGWSFSAAAGDSLFVREAYPDAEAVLSHLANVAPLREKLLAGPATLAGLELHGPAAALETCRTAISDESLDDRVVDALKGASFFEEQGGLSRLEKVSGGMPLPLVLVSLQTTFTVSDAAAATGVCDEIVRRAESEENLLYCGWTRNGDQLVCREAYGSATGLVKHVENVRDCMDSLTSGPATFEASRLHASIGQMKTFNEFVADTQRERGYCSKETKQFLAADLGYSRFEVQQSMFGFFFRK